MPTWMRRVRGAVGMGVTWALVWAPAAVLLGTLVIDPDNSMDEMWVMVGALPGFLGGVIFSIVLGIAARHRRLEELSMTRVTLWGALAGFLVGSLPFTIGTPTNTVPLWWLATVVIGSITALSALSAAASLAIARKAAGGDDVDVGPAALASGDDVLLQGGAGAGSASRTARDEAFIPR